ncbi:NAD(P)-dependent oxidoreductase [Leptospira brenneri]|uniref:NAD(P)-dependent oxidoreductase n=1 Tax=Leptospira brenneri TaxID=2023182 RepID=UPI000C2A2C9A|nr:NAD(P)H-binding protein [Leptospira brenneri]PJZ46997.1 hypothetical protein CH361_01205 [Leptospira brenneri]
MKILLFGATGAIGKLLAEKLFKNGHELIVYTRSPEKLNIENVRLRVVEGKLNELHLHDSIFDQIDAVVTVMGPPLKRNYEGMELTEAHKYILQAMIKHKIKRFITLATPSVRFEKDKNSLMTWFPPFFARLAFPKAYKEITAIGEMVKESKLDWTIVRIIAPIDKQTNPYKVSFGDSKISFSLSREQIAEFFKDSLEQKSYIHSMPIIGS